MFNFLSGDKLTCLGIGIVVGGAAARINTNVPIIIGASIIALGFIMSRDTSNPGGV
ncbi:MAG: hypothetical protein ACYS1A_16835 [Planctomycetota bacterium]